MTKRQDPQFELSAEDFENMELPYGDEGMGELFESVINLVNSQMNTSVELTRLISESRADGSMDEEKILNLYKRCLKVVSDTSPLKSLTDQLAA